MIVLFVLFPQFFESGTHVVVAVDDGVSVMVMMWFVTVSSFSFDHRQLYGGFFSRECCHDDGGGGAWGGDVRFLVCK